MNLLSVENALQLPSALGTFGSFQPGPYSAQSRATPISTFSFWLITSAQEQSQVPTSMAIPRLRSQVLVHVPLEIFSSTIFFTHRCTRKTCDFYNQRVLECAFSGRSSTHVLQSISIGIHAHVGGRVLTWRIKVDPFASKVSATASVRSLSHFTMRRDGNG